MKLRRFTWMLAAPALLLALGLTAWYWLLHSESGARWLFARLQSSLPASLEMSGLSGDLGSGLQLTGVEYDDGATRLEAGLLKLAVNIDLIPPAVTLESLQAESVAVRPLLESGGESEPVTPSPRSRSPELKCLTSRATAPCSSIRSRPPEACTGAWS
jgi:autotransporter translocation and assembly factor TamB